MLSCTPVEQISGKVRLVLCLQWSSHCRIGEFNNGKDQLDVYGNSTMLHALDHFPMLTTGSLSSFKDRKTNLLAYQINKLTGFFSIYHGLWEVMFIYLPGNYTYCDK